VRLDAARGASTALGAGGHVVLQASFSGQFCEQRFAFFLLGLSAMHCGPRASLGGRLDFARRGQCDEAIAMVYERSFECSNELCV
jgi:hypothetical protein